MRRASRNYSFASFFLPRHKLHHIEALYALMRVGDDRVDVSHAGFASPQAAIQDWEDTYHQAFKNGYSPHPVMRAFLNTSLECGIPPDTMDAYFCAMKDDLTVSRYPTFDDLLHYMAGSALPVGRAMLHILGVRAPYTWRDALPYADSLSIAMQLSNFWRDVGQDYQRGRIYLPQQDMERFGIMEQDLAIRRITPGLVNLLEYEFERTERYYRRARPGVQLLASGRLGVMTGWRVYRAILHDIRRRDYDVFSRHAGTSLWQKLGHVAQAARDLKLCTLEPETLT
jgi:phytoene synthase